MELGIVYSVVQCIILLGLYILIVLSGSVKDCLTVVVSG